MTWFPFAVVAVAVVLLVLHRFREAVFREFMTREGVRWFHCPRMHEPLGITLQLGSAFADSVHQDMGPDLLGKRLPPRHYFRGNLLRRLCGH